MKFKFIALLAIFMIFQSLGVFAADPYGMLAPNSAGLDAPAYHAATVTPSDGSALAIDSRALWVGTAGTVCIDTSGGETNQCFTSATGWMPLRAHRVYATGTTASGILEVW